MIEIIVPVSGGKDSQACLQMAIEQHGSKAVKGLFCDTQFEHPKTYKHIEFMQSYYGVEIDMISAGTVDEKCEKYGRFPQDNVRFCTEELKIVPSKKYYAKLNNVEVWLGMRQAESSARNKRYADIDPAKLYLPNDVLKKYPKYLGKQGVMFRLPILKWTAKEVLDYLDGKHNPLYAEGFDRVGCFPCLASSDNNKMKAFGHDKFGNEQYARVQRIEVTIGKSVFKQVQQNNNEQMFEFECPICSM